LTIQSISKDPNSKSTVWKRHRVQGEPLINKRSRPIDKSVDGECSNDDVIVGMKMES
jgi:hypothetical protein